MENDKYLVTPSELRKISGTIGSLTTEAESCAETIDNYVEKISEGWQSNASLIFRNNLKSYHGQLSNALSSLEKEREMLNQLAISFEEDDKDIVRSFD